MTAPLVRTESRDGIRIIWLADPATLNAISPAMLDQLDAILVDAPRTHRAVLLTGEGRAFCSGADLGGDVDPTAPGYDAGLLLETHYNRLMERLKSLPIPVVTAVNGPAAGVGCAIALAGDLIFAGESAYFLQAFRRIGLVSDGGSAFLLGRGAGRARAMEAMLLGERIAAAKALEWGLVNRVVADADLVDAALALATELARGPTKALGMIRRLAWASMEMGFTDLLALERELQREAGATADHAEGVAAFQAKREARFDGR